MEKISIKELYNLKKKVKKKRKEKTDNTEAKRNTASLSEKNLKEFIQPFDWEYATSTFKKESK